MEYYKACEEEDERDEKCHEVEEESKKGYKARWIFLCNLR